MRLLVKPLGALGLVECAWPLEVEGLSSRPDSALTGWATLNKSLNFFELQLLHLQNGDNKAIYFSILLWGCDEYGNCASTMQIVIIISLVQQLHLGFECARLNP